MAIREILEAPDPRLKVVSSPVEKFDDDLKTLVDDMFETMYAAHGIGLAAIQVGEPIRLLVIDLQEEDPDAEPVPCDHDGHAHTHQPIINDPRVFVNPEILDPSDDTKSYQEGCLSVPDVFDSVERPKKVKVEYLDYDGEKREEIAEDLFAVCIQRTSKTLRSIGANQSAATLSFGKARLTQMGPSARSMHQISDDTPPGSGTAGKGVIPSCKPLLTKKSRNSGGRAISVMTILCSSDDNSNTVRNDLTHS